VIVPKHPAKTRF